MINKMLTQKGIVIIVLVTAAFLATLSLVAEDNEVNTLVVKATTINNQTTATASEELDTLKNRLALVEERLEILEFSTLNGTTAKSLQLVDESAATIEPATIEPATAVLATAARRTNGSSPIISKVKVPVNSASRAENTTALKGSSTNHVTDIISSSVLNDQVSATTTTTTTEIANDTEAKTANKHETTIISVDAPIAPPPLECSELRGESGYWEKNDKMGKFANYVPLMGFRQRHWHAANPNDVYLPVTTFAWRDDTELLPEKACPPIEPFTKDKFCNALQEMKIKNFILVGDSLTYGQWISFVGLMGKRLEFQDQALWAPQLSNNSTVEQHMRCRSNGHRFRAVILRDTLAVQPAPDDEVAQTQMDVYECADDRWLKNNNHDVVFKQKGLCGWHHHYLNSTGRALMILNGGAHYHTQATFRTMFDGLLDVLDHGGGRPDDIIWFRTTSPGHKDCWDHGTVPHQNYSEFESISKTTDFNWDEFDGYNAYVMQKIAERRGRPDVFPLGLLKIHNMTQLRPDGHTARNDCLHYENPGPIDWWNYLMYTNLKELAKKERTTARESLLS